MTGINNYSLRNKDRNKKRNGKTNKESGFVLAELLAVIFALGIIIVVVVDIFLSIIQHQSRLLSEQDLLNQTSYTVEYVSRALRMAKKDTSGLCLGTEKAGYNYVLTNEGNGIKFINHSNNDICQEFFWDSNDKKIKEIKDSGQAVSFISDNLQVNYFKIKLSGESESDDLQPRVTISMEIQVKGSGDLPKKQIQTTISQRNLDQ